MLNQTIHVNEQASAIMREFVAGMTADELREEGRLAWFRMTALNEAGQKRDALAYCLAACKYLEMVEQKEREETR